MNIERRIEQIEDICQVVNQSMSLDRLARRAALVDVLLDNVHLVVLYKDESSLPVAIIRTGGKDAKMSALFVATSMAVQGATHARPRVQQSGLDGELHLTIAGSR